MSAKLRFDGQVVIVTGGAGALGEAYCLAFAARGAAVVVSDVGAQIAGDGQNTQAADRVVQKIVAAGGRAVADYHNIVTEGEKVVEAAIQHFGKVDVLVNNAGNLRDKSFRKMSLDDWEAVQKVHVLGAFKITRAAWPHFERQKYGRVIMTASAAGLYGSFGQTNYSAAKLGLAGLAQSLAMEGAKYNILVNTIAPLAKSRMLATILPEELIHELRPENIGAMVLYLCHSSCKESGGLFELGGRWYSRLRWQRSEGASFPQEKEVTPEAIASSWAKINSFDQNATNPSSGKDAFAPILSSIDSGEPNTSAASAIAALRSRL